jgi:DNA repair exonuclease SbcCD ATPase subunit
MNFEEIERAYEKLKYDRQVLANEKIKLVRRIRETTRQLKYHKDARNLLNTSIKIVHENFKSQIEETITKAIQQVFNRNITFHLLYEDKRNEMQTKIVIKENGEELDPKDDLGGSIIDIISFIFRLILWNSSSPKTRNTFILDEPFKWMGELSTFAGKILKDLSKKMNFQIIFITHDDKLIEIADKVFKISHINGKSQVKVIRKKYDIM